MGLVYAMKFYDFKEEISSKKHSSRMSFYKEIFITVQYGQIKSIVHAIKFRA
jgi:hypothetical protein